MPDNLLSRGEQVADVVMKHQSEIEKVMNTHKDKGLFLGIRSNYMNIYYMGASIAKITTSGNVAIAGKYLDITGTGRKSIPLNRLNDELGKDGADTLRSNVTMFQSGNYRDSAGKAGKKHLEKIVQQELIIHNNRKSDSPWYCIDMEYTTPHHNSAQKQQEDTGRFDIIAISRHPGPDKRFRVLLVELKYGTGAYQGPAGIADHINDYMKFLKDNQNGLTSYQKLLYRSIIYMLHTKSQMQLPGYESVPDNLRTAVANAVSDTDVDVSILNPVPEIAIVSLGIDDIDAAQQKMSRYLFDDVKGRSDNNAERINKCKITPNADFSKISVMQANQQLDIHLVFCTDKINGVKYILNM